MEASALRPRIPNQSLFSGCCCPVDAFHGHTLLGLLCHLDDACVSNPCHEDAICDTNPMNGRAICTCPPGFTGGACDQDVDECSIGERVAPFLILWTQGRREVDSLSKGLLLKRVSSFDWHADKETICENG